MGKYIFSFLGCKNIIMSLRYMFLAFVIAFGIFTIVAPGGGSDGSDNDDTNGTTYDISGYIQKGPFISGSSVTIYELDSNLDQTGVSFQTQTVDDFGSFILPKKVSSKYIEIISNGFYFNEVQGNLSSAPLNLSTISEVTEGKDIYVNILTCVADKRIRYLVQNEEKSFEDALVQAESEVLAIFNINETDILDFDQMTISEEGNSNAILLAVSVILQGTNTVAELSELISKISLDIEKDGTLDNYAYIDEITNNAMALDLGTIRNNLENRYGFLGLTVTIPSFEYYVPGHNLFLSWQTFTTGDSPQSVAIGDLDGNGDLDLAVANLFSYNVSVHLNNGDGTFETSGAYHINEEAHYVAMGDLDNDGDIDLAVTSWLHPIVSVLLNNGHGTFAAAAEYYMDYEEGESPGPGGGLWAVAIGDLDGDTYLDLAVVRGLPNKVLILLNEGDGTFAPEVSYSAGNYVHDVAMGDLDGDSDLDLAVTESDFMLGPSESSASVFLNKGDGTFFAEVDYSAGEYPYSIELGDLDGDGYLDMAVADTNSEDDFYEVSVLLNNGYGIFNMKAAYDSGMRNYSMVNGDLDGDGDLDLFNGVSLLLNNGDATFATVWNVNPGLSGVSTATGDLDGDGDLDLAVVDENLNGVKVLLNNLND